MDIVKKSSGTITRDDYNNLVSYLGGPSSINSLLDDDLRMNTAAKGQSLLRLMVRRSSGFV
jgi:hypothetical protein